MGECAPSSGERVDLLRRFPKGYDVRSVGNYREELTKCDGHIGAVRNEERVVIPQSSFARLVGICSSIAVALSAFLAFGWHHTDKGGSMDLTVIGTISISFSVPKQC